MPKNNIFLINISGRGDKDMGTAAKYFGVTLAVEAAKLDPDEEKELADEVLSASKGGLDWHKVHI